MISTLHYITQEGPNGETHAEMARLACEAGVRWVQLRVKDQPLEVVRSLALETQAICREFSATFILNDYVELAKEINADGVHLGLKDMSTNEARAILGSEKIIGGTANTLEDVMLHVGNEVDYIGLGPFRHTSSKKELSPILGLSGYARILSALSSKNEMTPIIAIGGIQPEDVQSIFACGVHGIAVASVINDADNKYEIVSSLLNEIA